MATISFTTKFNLTTNPKKFVFIDTSDYAGQGIALADVNGSFKIYAPSGTLIYNNTDYTALGSDINVVVDTTNQTTIQLPLGLDGFPESGVYTITYTVYDSNLLTYSVLESTYTYTYVRPTIVINQTTDCVSPLFTSVDATNYVVNGITPTIDRTHTIDYPFGSDGEGNPVVGPQATIITSTFYPGTQTTEIESFLIYTFSDGLIVIDEVTGSQEAIVDCTDICGIYCCVRSLEQQMMQAAASNTSTYAILKATFSQVMGLVGLITIARTCNKSADISGYLTDMQSIAHCTDDCHCDGNSPSQVMGLGGLVNQVVVTSAGSPIVVTPVVTGSTTTYTISFDATLLSKLNGLYNTVVAAGTNVTVIDSGIVAGVRTFTVSGGAAAISTTESFFPRAGSGSQAFVIDNLGTVSSYVPAPAAPSTGTFIVGMVPAFQALGIGARLYCDYAIAVNGSVPDAGGFTLASGENPYVHTIDLTNDNSAASNQNMFSPAINRTLSLTIGDEIQLYALDVDNIGNMRTVGMVVTFTKIG